MNIPQNRRKSALFLLLIIYLCVVLTSCASDFGNNTTPSASPTCPAETENQSTPPHTHSYTQTVTPPTCTNEGYTTFLCDCGNSYAGQKVNALGHSYNDWVETIAPTTQSAGEAERKCTACGNKETKVLTQLIEGHNHNYSSKITTDATCTTDGVCTFTCSCGSSYTESIQRLGHNYTQTVTAPTCTEDGYTTHTCSRCDDSYTGNFVDASGHKYSSVITTEATCTDDGVLTYTCEKCTDGYTEAIAKLGHNYRSEVTKPTCTKEGCTTHTCSRCGDIHTDNIVSASGHKYSSAVTTAATCTVEGIRTYTCKKCTAKYTEAIAKLGHSYQSKVIQPTCKTQGHTIYSCSRCGYCYKDHFTDIVPHNFVVVETKAPTCTVDGYTLYNCSKCGSSSKDSVVEATGHIWSDSNCEATKVCTRCNASAGPSKHTWTAVVCESNLICSLCNAEGEFFEHNWYLDSCRLCNIGFCDYYGHSFDSGIRCNKCNEYDKVILDRIDSIFDEILWEGMSEFEIVKAIHDYLCLNTYYDYDTYNGVNYDAFSYTLRGPLLYGKAVCSGYTAAFSLLCEFASISCEEVSSGWQRHAWNIVCIDGNWYNIDVTWDDADGTWGNEIRYDFFLRSDRDFNHYYAYDENGNEICDPALYNKKYSCEESYPW